MKKVTGKNRLRRIMAFLLAALMVGTNTLPTDLVVHAATEQHPDCVTVTVSDEDGNAISGATVDYTIKEKEDGQNGFTEINADGITDSYGTVEVLASKEYVDGLMITATVSKDGYKTDDFTINAAAILAGDWDFPVVLKADDGSGTKPDIQDVKITLLDEDYTGEFKYLVDATAETEGVTIEYSRNGIDDWSEDKPKEKNAGDYPVYVKISKDGFNTYVSEELTATIRKIDITDIDITGKTLTYDEADQELVEFVGKIEENDNVTWYVNKEKETVESGEVPKRMAVGDYTVTLEVKRDNYNDYTKTVTATIQKARLDTAGLRVKGLNGTYTGLPQVAIEEPENQGDYTLWYQLDDGSGRKNEDEDAWTQDRESITVTDAGSYIVWVKAVKNNYRDEDVEVIRAENAVAPYNVYIAKANQTLSFDNAVYNDKNESSDELSLSEMMAGKVYDFKATGIENEADGRTITYEVKTEDAEDADIAVIDADGKLTVTGAGRITVEATLSGNKNYESITISHVLNVSSKNDPGTWITFDNSAVSYILGNSDGIPSNVARNNAVKDKGAISYSIVGDLDCGLSIDETSGEIFVTEYNKIVNAVEKAEGGILEVSIRADKTEYSKPAWFGKCSYPADHTEYVLKVSMADVPETAYTIYSENDTETALTGPNGRNGWYNTVLTIKSAEGYTIIRADKLEGADPSFGDFVKYGETIGAEVQDQGADVGRYVYLKNIETGNITKKIKLSVAKLDTVAPNNLSITFPDMEEKDSVKYYGDSITVTFTAYDVTSGVDHFDWKYTRESGASASILESDAGTVSAQVDKSDSTKYIGTLTLPREEAEQLRGNLQITAVDKADNNSVSYTDNGVFVIDTIAPTQKVEYKLKNNEGSTQVVGEKHYFSNNVEFTFKIVETNFYAKDVVIKVSKNGAEAVRQNVTWSSTENMDEYQATIELSEDADYVVFMTYEDRSGKIMTSYESEKVVVDKTLPVVEFNYFDYTDSEKPQSATVKITEHNFRANDIVLDVTAKDIAGNIVRSNNLQQYLRTCDWTTSGDVHTAIIDVQFVDGIYDLTFNYKDLALNPATEIKSSTFIVDRTEPDTDRMSISYSTPLLETILNNITFGFYNPNVTVTFTAHDNISGIRDFTWSYSKESGASDVNTEKYSEATIAAVQDAVDKTKFTATEILPKSVAEQLRGTVGFIATDHYNNSSNKVTDSNHVLVVDTIAPTMNVEYSAAVNSYDSKDYYNSDLTAIFTVTEANFYKEDVAVKIKKNNGTDEVVIPEWTDISADVHVGKISIAAADNHSNDGDYVFTVEYRDRSNNQMTTYTSNIKVIDTTKPLVEVQYSNTNQINAMADVENHQRKYFASAQTATITVTEHNFNAADVKYTIVAKDVAGNILDANGLYSTSSWTRDGDKNSITITYPGDANYTFDIEYTDLARLKADAYATDYFTVDTSKPTDLQISYSSSILETVLNAITFGYYNAKATVTISATDSISGINSMKYSYVKAAGVSGVNAELVDAVIDASSISSSNGGAVGTATFEIPRNALAGDNQFNGTVNFTATDRANNESDYMRDTKRIVVDNIAPTAEVQYNAPVQTLNGINYYDGDIHATVTVHEANFYSEDVRITVTKDGTVLPTNAAWSDTNTDVHVGTFTISGDGDYTVGIAYSDKSSNAMQEYTSEQMTIDTEIVEASITVNGQEADGKAFKDEVVPVVSFNDKNFESCEIKMYRTSYADKNIDVTDQFITGHISINATGGRGEFDTFDKIAENDGIYTITTELKDKAGHTVQKSITFTVNRFGSVYEYNDLLISLISDGGAYVQSVEDDLVITEYNADKLVSNSLNIEILRDGKPLDSTDYRVSPEINESVAIGSSGWYQYSYTIAKENFASDGVYKIAVSSKDATGNSPENNNYDDKNILFRVDSTAPEITSVTGLENPIVNATEQIVKYTVYDTIGLASVVVYIDDKETDNITDFSADENNYDGAFVLKESSNSQNVRFVVTDKAGNVTDTSSDEFTSSYTFNNAVTVSTNMFVRWFANKALFYGSIGGTVAVIGAGTGVAVFFRKRKNKAEQ